MLVLQLEFSVDDLFVSQSNSSVCGLNKTDSKLETEKGEKQLQLKL